MASGPNTYSGVLHVHTDQSDGVGTLEEVLESARRCELDFVVLTDHGTRGYAHDGLEGWHDGVLVLCGEEVTTPQGHLLAFETQGDVGKAESFQCALDEIGRQAGTAVSIHHQLPDIDGMTDGEDEFTTLPLRRAQLLEIWSFMDDFLANSTPESLMRPLLSPAKTIKGPARQLLRTWDRELASHSLPVVGGLNIHKRKQPLLGWAEFFPYQAAFNTVRTVVQCQPLPNYAPRAVDLLWNSLREGRSYVVNRAVASDRGFEFEYHPPSGRSRQMGETVEYTRGGRFRIRVPVEAEVVLRHNSQPLFWGTAQELTFPSASPGSYRVEVYLGRRLWILSNAIRLLDDEGTLQPTVSDVT